MGHAEGCTAQSCAGCARSLLAPLSELIRREIVGPVDALAEQFVAHLREGHGAEIAAIIFYGSCLFQQTRTPSSIHDFYVLTDDPLRYHRSLLHAGIGLVLPPNVYYASFPDGLRCKFCVMTVDQFTRETSARAHDVHHLGRFSKRFALVYSRDEAAAETVISGALQSMLALVPHSLALLPAEFTLERFVLKQLSLSYLGEERVAEPEKVTRLFEASREYYLRVYPELLTAHAAEHRWPELTGPGRYAQPKPTPSARARTEAFLRWSRYRGVLRWPKYMMTVDNWLEYVLDKLERHQGVRLELSERQRKHPILFGWPKFLEVRRRGLLS